MQVFSNLWGGEGFLTAASLLAMASVGMFNNVTDSDGNSMGVYYHCLDFATDSEDDKRWHDMADAYAAYAGIIFGEQNVNCLIRNDKDILSLVKMTNPAKLEKKFPNKDNLSCGCSEKDMGLDIKKGIYGKPWVGEAYYSNTDFGGLYSEAGGNIVIVNCGGYKGGGTAATFISLENRFNVQASNPNVTSTERFNVIAGPSTQFKHTTQIPNSGIYDAGRFSGELDLFEIPKIIKQLEEISVGSANDGQHRANIDFLRNQYERVLNADHDYRNLNPKYYMARFIDRIRSDRTLSAVKASFINIKSNLTPDGESYNYDITSDDFLPDNQSHKLHITNLLNARTIQEIAMNHSNPNYSSGKIFTFCSNANAYTIDGVFLPNDARKFYRFLVFSTLLSKYVNNCFYDISQPGASIMIDKWAIKKSAGFFKGAQVIVDLNKPEGQLNVAFANNVKGFLTNFLFSYVRPVLMAFMDIDMTSREVCFFPQNAINGSRFDRGIWGIVMDLITNIGTILDNPQVIKDTTEETISALMIGRNGKPNNFNETLQTIRGANGTGVNFLNNYQSFFPEYGTPGRNTRTWSDEVNINNVVNEADGYFRKILRYTYEYIEKNLI